MNVTVLLKDGGADGIEISAEMLGQLAQNIITNGSEWIQTSEGGSLEVTGLLIKGDQIGDRIILTGKETSL